MSAEQGKVIIDLLILWGMFGISMVLLEKLIRGKAGAKNQADSAKVKP
jgi:hypothetical protein